MSTLTHGTSASALKKSMYTGVRRTTVKQGDRTYILLGCITSDAPMLDAVGCNPRPVNMPVDYASYLLSSSPPGAGFQFLSRSYSGDSCPITIHSNGLKQLSCFSPSVNNRLNRLLPLKPIIVSRPESFEGNLSNNADNESSVDHPSSPLTPTTPPSPDGKSKKKVSFADHKGRALATVRIMTEPSDVPPRIRPEILSALTKGASAGVTDKSPLALNFVQPASDYLQFRDKLNRNCVSLENVILKDYSMMGTIKVKNLSFEKSVFVRATFDSWETSVDIPATYAANMTETQGKMYDTFTFEVHVPADYDPTKKIMFAVCFESDNQQFWDSNDGKNYEVTSAEGECQRSVITGPPLTPVKDSDSWTDFACWNHVDTSIPYW